MSKTRVFKRTRVSAWRGIISWNFLWYNFLSRIQKTFRILLWLSNFHIPESFFFHENLLFLLFVFNLSNSTKDAAFFYLYLGMKTFFKKIAFMYSWKIRFDSFWKKNSDKENKKQVYHHEFYFRFRNQIFELFLCFVKDEKNKYTN